MPKHISPDNSALIKLTEAVEAVNNTPLLTSADVAIPEPIEVDAGAMIDEVRKADIQLFNTRLRVTQALWSKATSFNKVLTLCNEFEKLVRMRRDILGLEYGNQKNNKSPGEDIIFPVG